MTPEQRQELIRLLQSDENISPEWSRILFPPEKREYELTYYGKAREEDVIADTLAVPLQPIRTFGKNGVDWHNMLIFGDNLQVMKSLVDMKKKGQLNNSDGSSGVRLIYIDPPFATKQDFQGADDQKAYQDKVSGSLFLEFLRKRLIFLRDLLTDDGFFIIHLDYRYVFEIKVLLDDIFGNHNFRNEIILKRSTKSVQSQFEQINALSIATYNVLLYSKNTSSRIKKLMTALPETEKGKWDTYWRSPNRPTMRYKIFGITPDRGQWRWEKDRAFKAKANYEIFIKQGGDDIELDEYYLNHYESTGEKLDFVRLGPSKSVQYYVPPRSHIMNNNLWIDISSSSRLTGYPTEKSEHLLSRCISWLTNKGDIVIDAFAGSGTTLAVAEKLDRRWIGIDCGKLSIYTIQKRMLNLRKGIGNKGSKLQPNPFTLYNAGLYDFSQLKKLPWNDWRFFALQLFQCRDVLHKIGGIQFDGYRQGASVMVFNHTASKHKDARVSEETVQEIHDAVGSRVGNKVFIIAPALSFDFQQDYLDIGKVRYYALRIPYSIIHELHRREFTALKQPSDEMAVNDTVDAVGFDFIRTPELKYKLGIESSKGQKIAYIKIVSFISEAVIRAPDKKIEDLETLSMVMLDYDYNDKDNVFDLDDVYYADTIENSNWKVNFPADLLGKIMMVVFLDIYGNEARVLIKATDFKKKKSVKKK